MFPPRRKVLGTGRFGVVLQALDTTTNRDVAVKITLLNELEEDIDDVVPERDVLELLKQRSLDAEGNLVAGAENIIQVVDMRRLGAAWCASLSCIASGSAR